MKYFVLKVNMSLSKEKFVTLAGNRTVHRCQAKSKRTQAQCRKASMKGRAVCRMHGGLSTGAKTESGKLISSSAPLVHGRERRVIRKKRAQKFREMKDVKPQVKNLKTVVDLYKKSARRTVINVKAPTK